MKVAPAIAVTALTMCAVLPATAVLAYCPTPQAARQGFILVASERPTRLEVKPSSSDFVTYDIVTGGKVASTPTYYKGLYLVRFVNAAGTTEVTYDFDYTTEPDIRVGSTKSYRLTLKAPDGTFSTSAVSNRVVGQEQQLMGDCTLATFVVEGETTSADRPMQKRHANYSPVLRMFTSGTLTSEGSRPVVVAYDRIEPLRE